MAYRSHPNVTATDSLETRLAINQKYGSFDFRAWVLSQLFFQPGMDVLDVGCGTGGYAISALEGTGPDGTVCAFDLAADSVAMLAAAGGSTPRLHAVVGDMRNAAEIIRQSPIHAFDVAYSIYALWYSPDHHATLDAMRNSLTPGGRLVVCTPTAPNGLREAVKSLGLKKPELDQATSFGPNVLEPYFRAYFDDVRISLRRNALRITSSDDVLAFYRATGYYDPALEAGLKRRVEMDIESNGFFLFEKNNYLIDGRR